MAESSVTASVHLVFHHRSLVRFQVKTSPRPFLPPGEWRRQEFQRSTWHSGRVWSHSTLRERLLPLRTRCHQGYCTPCPLQRKRCHSTLRERLLLVRLPRNNTELGSWSNSVIYNVAVWFESEEMDLKSPMYCLEGKSGGLRMEEVEMQNQPHETL